MNRDFIPWLNEHFRALTDETLSSLKPGEDLSVGLEAEDSTFLRFNANRVRQNTQVEQITVAFRLQTNGRTVDHSRVIGGNRDADLRGLAEMLEACRAEARLLPADPNQVGMRDGGRSHDVYRGTLADPATLIDDVAGGAEGSDLAGLYCGGALVRANRNSRGQDHWFANETFFLDYSLYDGNRAAKGVLSDSKWDPARWRANLARTRESLALLAKPVREVPKGKHRVFLGTGAMTEIMWLMSWGGFSAAGWKQGRNPFKKLIEGECRLSPKFTMRENFGLGFAPRFNALGEVAPETVPLIENGRMASLLTSSRTAKEYGLVSNQASEQESPRSPEILTGTLPEKDVLRELGTGLYLSNLHYLNWSDPVSARITGMTRYACFRVEKGEIVGPIKDLRFDESLFEALGSKLIDLTSTAENDPSIDTYGVRSIGGRRTPGALINDFTFTL